MHGGSLVVQGDRELVWYDLATGEEQFGVRIGADDWWYLVGQGEQYLYLGTYGEVRAFSAADEGEVWSHDLDTPDTQAFRVGDHLFQRTAGLSLIR